jgi:hypothetical protein
VDSDSAGEPTTGTTAAASGAGRWARAALTLALVPLGLKAFGSDEGWIPILSDINLAIHEFGHLLFTPFGETGVIMGGSLTQIAFPLLFLGYFLWGKREHRDRHAATVCLWWAAINLLSVAVYMGDARAGKLMLITGTTGEDDPGTHDFYMLFAKWGVLNNDTVYAGRLELLAALVFGASILGGLWAAYNHTSSARAVTPG